MRYRPPATGRSAPLSPQVFQILVSLVDGPRHGYAVIQDIRERTADEVLLTASTLYDALARLLDQEWIEEIDAPAKDETAGARRRYYRLTAAGREAVRQEAARLERQLATVRGTRLVSRKRS
jgi:DNA-binding PadR family transcriptional regulator